jgi:hypothetical protein
MSSTLRLAVIVAVGLLLAACDSGRADTARDGGSDGAVGTDGGAQTDGGVRTDGGAQTDAGVQTDAGALAHFSFFMTSLKALRELSGSQDGFGGDLRFGETGPGAGLRGADKICATIAETSMPGAGTGKVWRAFLSATADENGAVVNAADRIGEGPWYDRVGRLVSANKTDLLQIRPASADAVIKNDLPNEDGVPNHNPDGTGEVDNHATLTGSNASGQLFSATSTCLDWTTSEKSSSTGRPHMGRCWTRGSGATQNDSWIAAMDESGCGAGINLIDSGGSDPNAHTVGSGGGYGGFYCFATTP